MWATLIFAQQILILVFLYFFPPCSLLDTLDTAEARLTNCQGIGEICSLYRTTPFTVKPGQA